MKGYQLPQERAVLSTLRQYRVKRAQLFGSAARGELTEQSDIDLLVEFVEPTSVFTEIELSQELQKITNRKVDVMSHIHPVFLPYIQKDLVDLAI